MQRNMADSGVCLWSRCRRVGGVNSASSERAHSCSDVVPQGGREGAVPCRCGGALFPVS